MIGQLPHWGQYKSALANDDHWAAVLCDMEDDGQELPGHADEDRAMMLDYSPVVARLDMLADRLMLVRTAVQANYTKDHAEPNFQPLDRPTTALDRERERRARNLLLELDALVLGDGLAITSVE